jgi:hypothetical protein
MHVMTKPRRLCFTALTVLIVSILLAGSYGSAATETKLAKPIHIQAHAMGTSTQMGRSYNITAIINQLSSPEDQKVLLEAFQTKGNEGLVNTLSKMPSKGRLAITGTLGGDLAYIRRFNQPDGSVVIRMITNRLLRFGEVWADTRSSDYQLTGLEIIFSKDKKHNKGTLIPAAELKLNKKGQLEIETYQNPWNLVNIMLR